MTPLRWYLPPGNTARSSPSLDPAVYRPHAPCVRLREVILVAAGAELVGQTALYYAWKSRKSQLREFFRARVIVYIVGVDRLCAARRIPLADAR